VVNLKRKLGDDRRRPRRQGQRGERARAGLGLPPSPPVAGREVSQEPASEEKRP
jgi:hypothetical protein